MTPVINDSKGAEIPTSVENTSDFDTRFRRPEKDHVSAHRNASATSDSESRPRLTGERMICEELASLANRSEPFSGSGEIVACDEIHDVEEV
jgi:hypothetical protein